MCNCIATANKQLRASGHKLSIVRMQRKGARPEARVLLRARPIDPMKRGRGPIVLATHCPYCGQKYGDRA